MNIVLIAGSPAAPSRSAALLDYLSNALSTYGVEARRYSVHQFDAADLLLARFQAPAVRGFQDAVAEADAIIVATPVYKAAYAGALKVLLDLLPQHGLAGKSALPLASGGSTAHLLAVGYALKPVLGALGAKHVLQGVFAVDTRSTVR